MMNKLKSRENVITPWGKSDSATFWCDGITFYGTPSHGGLKVCSKLNKQIPYPFRDETGWYEEDCAFNIPWHFLFHKFTEITDDEFKLHWNAQTKEQHFGLFSKEYAKTCLKTWYRAEYCYYFKEDTIYFLDEMQEKYENHPTLTTDFIDEKWNEFLEKFRKIKANADRNLKIEIGKTIVFDEPVTYGKVPITEATIVKHGKTGKALIDGTGRRLRIPSKSSLKYKGYKVV